MRMRPPALIFAILFLVCGLTAITEAKKMKPEAALNDRQQGIVTIAAFTASGDLKRLKPALQEGLDAGLTINEIKEVLVQMYAYAGFPRSLNGLGTFMGVVEERKAQGIKDVEGRLASALPAGLDRDAYGARVRADLSGLKEVPPPAAWQQFCPIIDGFLKEHLFADIFARDVLTHQERELATVAALANMSGTAGQLAYHLGAAMHSGLTQSQMHGFIAVLEAKVGHEQAADAEKALTDVLAKRQL